MATGSLEAYIQTVNRFPILSAEQERELALRSVSATTSTRRASWWSRTCGWWWPWRAAISATACRTPT